jgi:hypothetical protein
MGSNLMRTVTFADLDVVDRVKKNFVAVWHNQSPELYSSGPAKQEKYTTDQVRAYPQGGGGGNVRSYFCTPDGKVLYYLEGFWTKERYLAEAGFARDLADKGRKHAEAELPAVVRQALEERGRQVADERRAIRAKHPTEFEGRFQPTEVRKREAALGLLEKTLQASAAQVALPVRPIMDKLRAENIRRGILK